MGTEESVSVLREGDICLNRYGGLVEVTSDEFPYEHEGWVYYKYPKSKYTAGSIPANELTRIDPAFYKLYGIEECDYEGPTRKYRIW